MRTFRPVSIPENAHPFIKRLFTEMNHQQIGTLDMCERAGINPNTVKDWRTRSNPGMANLNACLNVLGLELKVVKMRDE